MHRAKMVCIEKKKQNAYQCLIIVFVTVLAIGIRFAGKDYISGDFENCLYPWYLEILNAGPGIEALQAYTGDYAMPYAFIIWLLTKLPVPFLYSLKVLNGIFDFALAILSGKLVQYFKEGTFSAFFWGYTVVLLVPNVFLNSCYWGQCDGMYTTFLLAAVLCLLYKKYPAMMIFLGLTLSFKLQAIFIFPFILLIYWVKKEFSILLFALIPVTMVAMNIPAMIAGYSPMITFVKYMGQTESYPWLYYFYPNLWFFFQARPYYQFSTSAILLALSALMIFIVLFVQKKKTITSDNILSVLLWMVYTCVFFLPSMHERYGFFAEIIALIMAVIYIQSSWIAAGMIISILPKYLWALDIIGNPVSLQMVSAIGNTVVYMVYTCILWQCIFGRRRSNDVEN